MGQVLYLTLVLGLGVLLYVLVRAVRRVGGVRVAKAIATLIASVVASGMKLVTAGAGKNSRSRLEPLDFSGTGGRYNARTGNYDNGQDPFGIYPNDDHRF